MVKQGGDQDKQIVTERSLLLGDAAKDPANLPEAWAGFVRACKQCQACDLAATRHEVVVFRGGVNAPLLILGEGPGRDEDLQGLPFCGRSGRLLDAALKALEFSPQDIHVANMVKCRPPQNRAPRPDELESCRPLLRAQFRLLKPRVVLLLGNTAFQNFTGQKIGISKARGKWLMDGGIWVLPSFHPAYILRDQRKKPDLFKDLLKARSKLEELGLIKPMNQPFEL